MHSWLSYLKRGLSRTQSDDRLASTAGQTDARRNLHNLRPFLDRHWRKGALGVLLILFTTLIALPQPLIMRYLIDDVILDRQLGRLVWVALLLAGVKGAGMLANALQQFTFTRFEQEVLLDIQHHLFERTLRFPKSFFDDKEVGYLMSRLLSDVSGLRWFFSGTLVHVASSLLRLAGGLGLLLYLEWRLAVAVMLLLPLLVLAVRFFSPRLRALGHQSMEQQANVSRSVQESLSAAALIKASSTEERAVGRVMAELRTALQLGLEQTTVSSAAGLAIGLTPELGRAVVLLVGAYWIIQGDWTLGSLLAFQSYLGYVYSPAQFLASANLQLQHALAALERVSALFDIVPEENLGVGQPVERLRGQVEFRQVSFSYDGSEMVLEDVSCVIQPGERVAIVGPSGVGKTTLISLILRFYRPTRGEIWFDGLSASEYEVGSLRRRIGYVSQSTLLLSGTIADNLRYANPDASMEQVVRAARTAGIHDFVAALPQGYDAPVGERGVNLSEGQKQRLAIARALIQEPDILVLDEPTAALDSLTERSIMDALPEAVRGKTLFVVAHRLSTIQSADRILLLNEKRLVATGTHRELWETNDYYRSLVASE